MISLENIKTFLTAKIDSVKNIVKSNNKDNKETKSDVTNKTDENSLVDTSKLEENNKQEEGESKFKRILLGIATLGISEIVRKVKENKAEKEAKELEEKKQQERELRQKEYEEFQKACEVNGKIDQKVSQGNFGDCELISAIYALSQNEKGAQILKDAITTNYDKNGNVESYTIDYKGIGEKVTVTKEELDARNETSYYEGLKGNISSIHIGSGDDYYVDTEGNEGPVRIYSTGDDDMLLLEIGWEKLCKQVPDKIPFTKNNPLCRVHPNAALGVFADVKRDGYYDSSYIYKAKENYLEEKIKNLKGEFKLSDIGLKEGEPVFAWYGNNKCDLPMNKNDIYEIEKIDDDWILLKNKTKNTKGEISLFGLTDYLNVPDITNKAKKEALLDFNNNHDVITMGFYDNITLKKTDNKKYELVTNHAYAVKKMTDKTITLVNPWDTSDELTFTFEEFFKTDSYIKGFKVN